MTEANATTSSLLARLTISAIHKASRNPNCWSEPAVYNALLVSGLSVLLEGIQLLEGDHQFKKIVN